MTVTQLVILPGILLAAFLAGLLWLAGRIAAAHLREVAARRQQAEVVSAGWQDRYRALRDRQERQADVIAAVITELESRPATYSTFPEDLRDSLMAAHETATQPERNHR